MQLPPGSLDDKLLDFCVFALSANTNDLKTNFKIPKHIRRAKDARQYYLWHLLHEHYAPEKTQEIINCIDKVITDYQYKKLIYKKMRKGLITDQQIATIPFEYVRYLREDEFKFFIQALGKDKVITAQEIAALPSFLHVCELFKNGRSIQAFREQLITPKEIAAVDHFHVQYLFENEFGIEALRMGKDIATIFHYFLFLSEYGVEALRDTLITLDQIFSMPELYVYYLFNNKYGIQALREKLITPQDIANMPSYKYVKCLFESELGIQALRNGITPLEIASIEGLLDMNLTVL